MALATVPVPRPPVWPQPVPLGLRQGHQIFATMGETLNSLSRRFSDNGFLQGTSTGSDNTGICEDESVGVVGKRQKLHSNPLSADYLLGYDNRHDIDDHPHTRQEYSIDSMNGLQASLSAINNMNTTRSIH